MQYNCLLPCLENNHVQAISLIQGKAADLFFRIKAIEENQGKIYSFFYNKFLL